MLLFWGRYKPHVSAKNLQTPTLSLHQTPNPKPSSLYFSSLCKNSSKPSLSLSIRPQIPNPNPNWHNNEWEGEDGQRKYTQIELWARRKERRKRSNDGERSQSRGDGRDERTRRRPLPPFNQVCRFKLGFWFGGFHWKVKVLIEQLQNYVKLENLKEL